MAEDESGMGPLRADKRLASLDERLQEARALEAKRTGSARDTKNAADYRLGNRVLAELLGGLIGGGLIGFTLDQLLGTSPWLLLALLVLGIIGAFRNIIRISNQRSK